MEQQIEAVVSSITDNNSEQLLQQVNGATSVSDEQTLPNNLINNIDENGINDNECTTETQEQELQLPVEIQSVKEKELLDLIFKLESDQQDYKNNVQGKFRELQKELEKTTLENKNLNGKINDMEKRLQQSVKNTAGAANSAVGKNQVKKQLNSRSGHDDEMLTKAKTLLFEKTKLCKQQEQQLDALRKQVIATKDVAEITKEMLNLRNIENNHMQARFDTMELRVKSERDRLAITEKKLEISKKMYTDLKTEYDIQTGIFKELRSTYEEKIALLTKQLEEARSAT